MATWDQCRWHQNILDLVPPDFKLEVIDGGLSADDAIAILFRWDAEHRWSDTNLVDFRTDISIAGIPCVDYSPMVANRRLAGPSFDLIIAWAFIARHTIPFFIIIENIVAFPTEHVYRLVGDLYLIESVVICPTQIDWPIRRRRKYLLLSRKGACRITRALSDWRSVVSQDGARDKGLDLFSAEGDTARCFGQFQHFTLWCRVRQEPGWVSRTRLC